jgi:hypothetical protein
VGIPNTIVPLMPVHSSKLLTAFRYQAPAKQGMFRGGSISSFNGVNVLLERGFEDWQPVRKPEPNHKQITTLFRQLLENILKKV